MFTTMPGLCGIFATVMLFPHGYSFIFQCCFENLVMKNFTIILHFHLQGLVVIFFESDVVMYKGYLSTLPQFLLLMHFTGIRLRHGCLRMRMLSSRSLIS